jgi:hypothetical protein
MCGGLEGVVLDDWRDASGTGSLGFSIRNHNITPKKLQSTPLLVLRHISKILTSRAKR